MQALESRMLEENGCVVPWLRSDGPICTGAEEANATFWTHYNRVTNQMGDCPTPCESLIVNIGGKNYKKYKDDSQGQVRMATAMEHDREPNLLHSPALRVLLTPGCC